MPKAKTDAEVKPDQKPPVRTEGKSLEAEKTANLKVGFENGKNAGNGEPLPQKQIPQAEAKRINIKFTNGKIDTEQFRGENDKEMKELFKASVQDPKVREWAGISNTTTAEGIPVKIPPEVAGAVLDIVPFAAAWSLQKRTGLQMKEVYPLVRWDAADHGILDKQAANLADKYMPESWKAYTDVGIFFLTVITLFKMKTAAVEAYAKKELEKIGKADKATFSQPPAQAPPPNAPAVDISKPRVPAMPPPAAAPGPEQSRSLE